MSLDYRRYQLGRALIHLGLKVMPPGRVRTELEQLLWGWNLRVRHMAGMASPQEIDAPALRAGHDPDILLRAEKARCRALWGIDA